VVATAAAGVLEIARHGESALVVPPRDAEALAGALLRLREQPELAARLISGARRVAAAHDVATMVDGTLRAYARLGRPTREAPAARLEAAAPSREPER
jgi:glycosyltransferase involved in cell wall biosynthesis